MSKLLAVFLLAFLIILPACGGDDDDDSGNGGDSGEIETCEQLADAAIDEMQQLLDGLSDMTMEDIQAGATPEALAEFEEDGEELQAKFDELNCADQEMAQMLDERASELTAEGPLAEMLLQELQSGNFFQGAE